MTGSDRLWRAAFPPDPCGLTGMPCRPPPYLARPGAGGRPRVFVVRASAPPAVPPS